MRKEHWLCVLAAITGIILGLLAAPIAFQAGYNYAYEERNQVVVKRVWPNTFEHMQKRTD